MTSLTFDNAFVRELPADPQQDPRVRQVFGAAYSFVAPTPVAGPRLVAHAAEVATMIGLSDEQVTSDDFAQVFAGNRQWPGMQTYATCYGGHQFGSWAGQLGDGRAISLGEVVAPHGGRYELQLKGAGRTPYSRNGDGRAVMRSSVREFLCSEAMHHLGIPTTRALSLVATGEQVIRDLLYDGRPRAEPGAVVCRVAPTFIRFGNFEIFAARREHDLLRALADHTIRRHFPLLETPGTPSKEVYARWFDEVCRRTTALVMDWMRVGFVHGVMNTDNMSILGLTIDYGPYGWLEPFDPDWTPNITDAQGRRYRYGQQPQIALWNLLRLGQALLPLVEEPAPLEQALQRCADQAEEQWRAMMRGKLGLTGAVQGGSIDGLIDELIEVLTLVETDMTIFFRALADLPLQGSDDERLAAVREAYYDPDALTTEQRTRIVAWLRAYAERAAGEENRRTRMNAVNPKYVLRNYLAQLAIDKAEQGDGSGVTKLLEVLRRPYEDQPGREAFAEKRPEWARNRPGCSMLSCSS